MICPACKNEMIVVEYQQIELDYCTNCRGVWFDNVELELLMQILKLDQHDIMLSDILRLREVAAKDKKRKCPLCNKTMKLFNISSADEIIIDACSRGHGLWFDGGELKLLLKEKV